MPSTFTNHPVHRVRPRLVPEPAPLLQGFQWPGVWGPGSSCILGGPRIQVNHEKTVARDTSNDFSEYSVAMTQIAIHVGNQKRTPFFGDKNSAQLYVAMVKKTLLRNIYY